MGSLIESTTSVLIGKALDATAMRQQAIAHNIANANTPGYRPLTVGFDSQMADVRATLVQGGTVNAARLAAVRPALIVAPINLLGSDAVALDAEVAKLSENTLQQTVLLKVLNRHYAIMGAAISEGKK
jgi:flagellar basal-body rod protein FlgB